MSRLGGGGLGLWMALLLGAGCEGAGTPAGDPVAPSTPAAPAAALVAAAPVVSGGPRPGFRVDLTGTAQHVRGLQRQPDGTYRSVCTDSPEALRPANPTGGER